MDDKPEPTESIRAQDPRYYWFHTYNGHPEFFWDDWEVTEDEYRRHASREDVAYLDDVLKRHFGK